MMLTLVIGWHIALDSGAPSSIVPGTNLRRTAGCSRRPALRGAMESKICCISGAQTQGRPAATTCGSPDMSEPTMFGQGIISTRNETVASTQAPDGTIIFVRACPGTLLTKMVLCETQLDHGRWQTPKVLPFSGTDVDFAPQFSPDGSHMLFISNREHSRAFQVWSVEHHGSTWSVPVKLGPKVNEKGHQLAACETNTGNLYVTSTRRGNGELFIVKQGEEPAPIETINATGFINDVSVAPDESFMVFTAIGGADEILTPGATYQRGDLYISFNEDGKWQKPVHLPPPINTAAGESAPSISPDGKKLRFASERGFMLHPHGGPLTYREIRAAIKSDQNCLSKIFEVDLAPLLAYARQHREQWRVSCKAWGEYRSRGRLESTCWRVLVCS